MNHQPFNLWNAAAPNDPEFGRGGFDEGSVVGPLTRMHRQCKSIHQYTGWWGCPVTLSSTIFVVQGAEGVEGKGSSGKNIKAAKRVARRGRV